MPNRRFVNELSDGETIEQVFLASEKQLRTNRNGNLYLQVRLNDRTGSVTSMLWNASQKHHDAFDNGDFVRVKGTAQLYNGGMQILAKQFDKVDNSAVDESDFVTLSNQKLESMLGRVSELLRSMSNVHLRNLAECYLIDETFMSGLRSAPAGVKNHHAYHGGLLEHILSLMEICQLVAPRYPQLNPDLLLMGSTPRYTPYPPTSLKAGSVFSLRLATRIGSGRLRLNQISLFPLASLSRRASGWTLGGSLGLG